MSSSSDQSLLGTFQGHSDSVWSVAVSPDGKYVYSGSCDNTVKKWDSSSGQCLRTFQGHSKSVNSVAVSTDGKYVYSGSNDKTVKKWDTSNGQCLATFQGHSDSVNSVAVSPDGKYVYTGSGDKTIKKWDSSNGQCVATFQGHSERVWSVAVSPDGKHVYSGSDDNGVKKWDTSSDNNSTISKPTKIAKGNPSTKRKKTVRDTLNIDDSLAPEKKLKSSQSGSIIIHQQAGSSETHMSIRKKDIAPKQDKSSSPAVTQPVNTTKSHSRASAFVNVPTINEKAWTIKEVTNNTYASEVRFTGPATYEIGYIKLKGNAEQRSTFLEALKHGIATATKVVNDELNNKIRISYIGHTENLARSINDQHFFSYETVGEGTGGNLKPTIESLRGTENAIIVFLIRYVRWSEKKIAQKVETEMLDYYFYPWNQQVGCSHIIKTRTERAEKRFDIHKKKFFEIKEEHC